MTTKQYLYKRVVQAKLFIDMHFAESIDLQNIAGEASFSKFHFIRLFKKSYGYAPHQYLTVVRLEKAKLLLHQNLPITEVCYAVGFKSISSFTNLFKKRIGLTPSAFQEKQRVLRSSQRNNPLKFIPGCFAEKRGLTQKKQF